VLWYSFFDRITTKTVEMAILKAYLGVAKVGDPAAS